MALDDEPDSVFKGFMNDAKVEATTPCRRGDHQQSVHGAAISHGTAFSGGSTERTNLRSV